METGRVILSNSSDRSDEKPLVPHCCFRIRFEVLLLMQFSGSGAKGTSLINLLDHLQLIFFLPAFSLQQQFLLWVKGQAGVLGGGKPAEDTICTENRIWFLQEQHSGSCLLNKTGRHGSSWHQTQATQINGV